MKCPPSRAFSGSRSARFLSSFSPNDITPSNSTRSCNSVLALFLNCARFLCLFCAHNFTHVLFHFQSASLHVIWNGKFFASFSSYQGLISREPDFAPYVSCLLPGAEKRGRNEVAFSGNTTEIDLTMLSSTSLSFLISRHRHFLFLCIFSPSHLLPFFFAVFSLIGLGATFWLLARWKEKKSWRFIRQWVT